MKILFSPSESKTYLGTHPVIAQNSFIFPHLFEKRLEVLKQYHDFLASAAPCALQQILGVKDENTIANIRSYPIHESLTCKAIERYNGVAYTALSYETLDPSSQHYIDTNVLIFSNLFGPLLAHDSIPPYKLKQGESIGAFKPEVFYKKYFSQDLDQWLKEGLILDLRAGFYEKFYTLKQPYLSMKFLKNGKSVSHFAKLYRGKVLRFLAQNNLQSEDALSVILPKELTLVEIKQGTFKREYVYNVID